MPKRSTSQKISLTLHLGKLSWLWWSTNTYNIWTWTGKNFHMMWWFITLRQTAACKKSNWHWEENLENIQLRKTFHCLKIIRAQKNNGNKKISKKYTNSTDLCQGCMILWICSFNNRKVQSIIWILIWTHSNRASLWFYEKH